MKITTRVSALIVSVLASTLLALPQNVPYQRILKADNEPQNWLTYSGDYQSRRYSQLKQIDKSNVASLKPAWIYQRAQTVGDYIEASPIVVDGIMYVVEPISTVVALDARTGMKIWSWTPTLPKAVNYVGLHANNRGIAILDNTVYVGTLDARLAALDAKTGALRWIKEVASNADNHAIAGAPLALDGKILIGTGGGDKGARGFLDAYDAKTGERLWRVWSAPGQSGDPGGDTWNGMFGGGGDTWGMGTYDAELNLVYWGTGNPSGSGPARAGDNLYSCSLLAIDPDTGKMKWYFQFTPHDVHDYDATQVPILFDGVVNGKQRKLLADVNRNGFYYVLDRATGEFIAGAPYIKVTWAKGLDAKGRPIEDPANAPSPQGTVTYPSLTGGTNWASPSYDPERKTVYVDTREMAGMFVQRSGAAGRAQGSPEAAPAGGGGGGSSTLSGDSAYGAIRALDVMTGKMKWEYRLVTPPWVSTLATAGGVVFCGDDEGDFFALDSDSGKLLWRFPMGGFDPRGSSVTYSIDGKQYVVTSSVNIFVAFALQ